MVSQLSRGVVGLGLLAPPNHLQGVLPANPATLSPVPPSSKA